MSLSASGTGKSIQALLASSAFGSILDIARTLILARMLGPEITGLFLALLAIPQSAQYLNLGSIEALTVLVPYYKGKGETSRAARIESSVLSYTLATSTGASLCVLLFQLLFPMQDHMARFSARLAASLIVLWETKQFFLTQYAVDGFFAKLGWAESSFSLLTFCLQIFLTRHLGPIGFWWGFVIANAAVILYGGRDYFASRRAPRALFRLDEMAAVIALGAVMLISAASFGPFLISARIFLISFAGAREVGFFFLASAVIGKFATLSSAVGRVLVPKMSRLHSESGSFDGIFGLFLRSQLLMAVSAAILIAAGFLLVHPLVELLLPKYLPGVAAAKAALLAAFPYALIGNANNVLLALQRKKTFFLIFLTALAVDGIVLSSLKIFGKTGSEHVAISLGLVFLYYAAVSNCVVFRLRRSMASRSS